jgi:hypothetical protein
VRRPQLTVITLDVDNRMFRWGFGKNKGKWFFRIDLWVKALRIS